mgnify:CR=1 FL=1
MRDANSPGPEGQVEKGTPDAESAIGAEVSTEPGSVHVISGIDRVRVILAGEVDADLASDLQDAITAVERAGMPVEVDTHHVTFMDSSGVAFLARLASRSAYRVKLLNVPPTVRFLLEVTRIGELLDVVDEHPVPEPPDDAA